MKQCKWCGNTPNWEWCSEEHKKEYIESAIQSILEDDDFSNSAIVSVLQMILETKKDN